MTKQELIADNLKKYEAKIKAVDILPDDDSINCLLCADGDSVYLKTLETWNECLGVLHIFAKHWGKYKVEGYYMNYSSELCIKYHFTENNMLLLMYCEEFQEAIKSLGQGKCRIESYIHEPQSYSCSRVVCDNL